MAISKIMGMDKEKIARLMLPEVKSSSEPLTAFQKNKNERTFDRKVMIVF